MGNMLLGTISPVTHRTQQDFQEVVFLADPPEGVRQGSDLFPLVLHLSSFMFRAPAGGSRRGHAGIRSVVRHPVTAP